MSTLTQIYLYISYVYQLKHQYIYIYIYIYILCVYMCMCVCVCVFVCMCACVNVCECVCVSVCVCVCVCRQSGRPKASTCLYEYVFLTTYISGNLSISFYRHIGLHVYLDAFPPAGSSGCPLGWLPACQSLYSFSLTVCPSYV